VVGLDRYCFGYEESTWGFGQVRARVNLDSIPVLEGAIECAQQGIFSSIYPDNARAAAHVSSPEAAASHPVWPLLFDPQTGVLPPTARSTSLPVPNPTRQKKLSLGLVCLSVSSVYFSYRSVGKFCPLFLIGHP
jgi:hypothetical protein